MLVSHVVQEVMPIYRHREKHDRCHYPLFTQLRCINFTTDLFLILQG